MEETLRALLAGTFLFRGAPEQALMFALSDGRCRRERAERGTVIYAPHRFRRCLAVVLAGRVQVNKGELIMSVLQPGDLFGAAALFNDRADYATTLTARSRCDLLFFPQALVEELMARFPAVGYNYVAYLSQRIWFLNEKIDALAAGSTEGKLAQYLLTHSREGWMEWDCSATGLAKRLGVSRASLYRALDALTASGAIRREAAGIRLLDEERLNGL